MTPTGFWQCATTSSSATSPRGDLAVFDREAGTFAAAVGGALADLERALPAAQVVRVEAVPAAGQLSVAATRCSPR